MELVNGMASGNGVRMENVAWLVEGVYERDKECVNVRGGESM